MSHHSKRWLVYKFSDSEVHLQIGSQDLQINAFHADYEDGESSEWFLQLGLLPGTDNWFASRGTRGSTKIDDNSQHILIVPFTLNN